MTTSLIIGVTGQDGAYLARHLLELGRRVVGAARNPSPESGNLARLGVGERLELRPLDVADATAVVGLMRECAPDEVYHLAGQSSVGASFAQPLETFAHTAGGAAHVLEAVRLHAPQARVFVAGSSEMFGDTGGIPADETTPVRPLSPYGVAKAAAFWQTRVYREAYGLFVCTGILFNHESPLRPGRFVTAKIVRGAVEIAQAQASSNGSRTVLELGNLAVSRDWGWAPEFVQAFPRMLALDAPQDLVLATGHSVGLEDFVAAAFAAVGLDWREHVRSAQALLRPGDIPVSRADPSRAAELLGWRAQVRMPEVARRMVAALTSGG